MGLLEGKKALIFGVANKHSIAWGIAQALHSQGAQLAFTYGIPELEKRVQPLAESIGVSFVEECNVNEDEAIDRVFAKYQQEFGTLDILIHAIAYAERTDLDGRFTDTSRAGFKLALETSAYSLVALARRAEPLMASGGTIVTLTYYGSVAVMPKYNVMGVAKAALESCVRYLAADLGPKNIRVNAISAGPIRTLAASGVGTVRRLLEVYEDISPLRRNVTQEDVGNTCLWLCSEWGKGVTGEIVYVDSGWNILGLTVPDFEEDEVS